MCFGVKQASSPLVHHTSAFFVFTKMSSSNQRIAYNGDSFHLKVLDKIHPLYGGNKWYKLKYNLEKAKAGGHDTILTFGGAYSNHIFATAAACKDHGFKSIGVIRGDEPRELNPTLQFAQQQGMLFQFVSREEYREKHEDFFKAWLRDLHGRFYLVPEGGSNYLGVQGCTEILQPEDREFEQIWCACGTGATLAGVILSLKRGQTVVGVSALKGDFMADEVRKHLCYSLGDEEAADDLSDSWRIVDDAHFGGYAKTTPELLQFMSEFRAETDVPLDQVYTAKMIWAMLREKPSNALAIHTGGLQGLKGLTD